MTKTSELGLGIEAGLRDALAHRRGQIALPVRRVEAMPAERIRSIRKAVAKSPKDFETRFGVPARTLEGWEQDRRRPDPAARALLTVIERDPDAVERALSAA